MFFPLNNSFVIIGVNEEVAHVSRTSFSGTNSVLPHFEHFFINGLSFNGSTGNCSSLANITSSHLLQYQTGNGTPKYLCLEMHQSHCSPLIQLSNLFFI